MNPELRRTVYIILVASQMLFCVVSYFPQILKLIRTKKSEDISIRTWILITLSFLEYGVILLMENASPALLAMNMLELLLCLTVTVLVGVYRIKRE